MNADDLRVGMLHSNKDMGPAFPDGDRLRHVRLGIGASNAMRREQAVLAHHPSHTAGARANASTAQPRP